MAFGLQSMNRVTARAAETSKINRLRPAGKVGKNKAMPPQVRLAMWTAVWFLPGKKTTKLRNILDGYGNGKYQLINSLQEPHSCSGGVVSRG
jgi:hypothetical protein